MDVRYPLYELKYDWNMVFVGFKVVAVLGFSALSAVFLARNFDILGERKIHTKYSTLYHNFQPRKKVLVALGCFFCLRRLALALSTTFINDHILPSLAIYFYGSIFVVSIGLSQKPLDGRWFNILENLNETFIIITGYFMLFFSEWVSDVFVRQEYGDIYVELLYGIIAVNVVVGLHDIAKVLRKKYL